MGAMLEVTEPIVRHVASAPDYARRRRLTARRFAGTTGLGIYWWDASRGLVGGLRPTRDRLPWPARRGWAGSRSR